MEPDYFESDPFEPQKKSYKRALVSFLLIFRLWRSIVGPSWYYTMQLLQARETEVSTIDEGLTLDEKIEDFLYL